MPLLFLVVFVISLGAMYGEHLWYVSIRASVGAVPISMLRSPSANALLRHLGGIGDAIIAVPLIRLSLRNDSFFISNESFRVYLRYFIYWISFVASAVALVAFVQSVSTIMLAAEIDQAGKLATIQTAKILMICGCAYFFARSSLVFPHIAVGGYVDWRTAWRDTRGNFWKIACIEIIAVQSPTYILDTQVIPFIHSHFTMLVFLLLSQATAKVLVISLSANCLAWLYRCFAREIRSSVTHLDKWQIKNL